MMRSPWQSRPYRTETTRYSHDDKYHRNIDNSAASAGAIHYSGINQEMGCYL